MTFPNSRSFQMSNWSELAFNENSETLFSLVPQLIVELVDYELFHVVEYQFVSNRFSDFLLSAYPKLLRQIPDIRCSRRATCEKEQRGDVLCFTVDVHLTWFGGYFSCSTMVGHLRISFPQNSHGTFPWMWIPNSRSSDSITFSSIRGNSVPLCFDSPWYDKIDGGPTDVRIGKSGNELRVDSARSGV